MRRSMSGLLIITKMFGQEPLKDEKAVTTSLFASVGGVKISMALGQQVGLAHD